VNAYETGCVKNFENLKNQAGFAVSSFSRIVYYSIGNLTMAASFLPSILVPLTGLVFPAVTMAFLLLYIERDDIA
jgi:photosystem I subunit 8